MYYALGLIALTLVQSSSEEDLAHSPVCDVHLGVTCDGNGHTYFESRLKLTHRAASELARSLGGTLVCVNDQEERDWLLRTFGSGGFWLGLEPPFETWQDGSPVQFTDWKESQPKGTRIAANGREPAKGTWYAVQSEKYFGCRRRAIIEVSEPPGEAEGGSGPLERQGESRNAEGQISNVTRGSCSLTIVIPGLRAEDLSSRDTPHLMAFMSQSSSTTAAFCEGDADGAHATAAVVWGTTSRLSYMHIPGFKNGNTGYNRPFVGDLEMLDPEMSTVWWSDSLSSTRMMLASATPDLVLSVKAGDDAERSVKKLSDLFALPAPLAVTAILTGGGEVPLGDLKGRARRDRLRAIDGLAQDFLNRTDSRSTRQEEDWLITFAGSAGSDGWRGAPGKSRKSQPTGALLMVSKDGYEPQELDLVSLCDVPATVLDHHGLSSVVKYDLAGLALRFDPFNSLGVNLLRNPSCELQGHAVREYWQPDENDTGSMVVFPSEAGVRGWCTAGRVEWRHLELSQLPLAPEGATDALQRSAFSIPTGSRAVQSVDITAIQTDSGSSKLEFQLRAFLGGGPNVSSPSLQVDWIDRSGRVIGSRATPPVKSSARLRELGIRKPSRNLTWVKREVHGKVPARASRARVWIEAATMGQRRPEHLVQETGFVNNIELIIEPAR